MLANKCRLMGVKLGWLHLFHCCCDVSSGVYFRSWNSTCLLSRVVKKCCGAVTVLYRNLARTLEHLIVNMERLYTATHPLSWVHCILDSCSRLAPSQSNIQYPYYEPSLFCYYDKLWVGMSFSFRHLKTTFFVLQSTCTRWKRPTFWLYERDTATTLERLWTFL